MASFSRCERHEKTEPRSGVAELSAEIHSSRLQSIFNIELAGDFAGNRNTNMVGWWRTFKSFAVMKNHKCGLQKLILLTIKILRFFSQRGQDVKHEMLDVMDCGKLFRTSGDLGQSVWLLLQLKLRPERYTALIWLIAEAGLRWIGWPTICWKAYAVQYLFSETI